jgi:hypothetical protein
MSITYDGVGTTIAFATSSPTGLKMETIGIPGWSKTPIDVSSLANTEYKTKVMATLKESGDFTVGIQSDTNVVESTTWADNESILITLPGTAGNLTIWGGVSNIDRAAFEIDGKPIDELTITVTNLNGSGVETGPAFST